MCQKLVDYYASYRNTYAQHDSAVIEEEIECIFEITSSLIQRAVKPRPSGRGAVTCWESRK